MGAYFRKQLDWLKTRHDCIQDVRGVGLLLGVKLSVPGDPVVLACMERGFLINCIQGEVLRFVPPLAVAKEDIDALTACLDEVLSIPVDA
jgi:acetylornithine/succinyldiaminopimelate/putrescine aminotransferase